MGRTKCNVGDYPDRSLGSDKANENRLGFGLPVTNSPGTSGLAQLVQLGQTLSAWSEEIVAMWRFTRNNGITEGFHNKMELINRQALWLPQLSKLQAQS